MFRIARAPLRQFMPRAPIPSPALRMPPPTFGSVRFLSSAQYHEIADEALESITESYEALIEQKPEIDVDLAQGVLTSATPPAGTYVINKQPPNMQIWSSSPISGPKRYDYHEQDGQWVYDRDNSTLGELSREETKQIYDLDLDLDLK